MVQRSKYPCADCIKLYQLSEKDPPCSTCRPETMEGNQIILDLFMFAGDQVIMGMEPVGLDLLRIDKAFDYFEIARELRKDYFKRLNRLFHRVQETKEQDYT